MGFEIVNRKETNVAENKALGISITSFRPIFISIQQAKQNLINLLLTRKGERLIHSNFGSDLMKLIFEPNILDIKELISDAITEPVSFWLPYIFGLNSQGRFLLLTRRVGPLEFSCSLVVP